MAIMKAQVFNPGDRVIRHGSKDRAVFFVVKGEVFGLDETFPVTRNLFSCGAVLGIDSFLDNDKWTMDVICKTEDTVVGKIDYESFLELRENYPAGAIQFYNRLLRHKAYALIYEKKNNKEYFTDQMEQQLRGMLLTDQDLLIDLQLGSKKEIHNLFIANR